MAKRVAIYTRVSTDGQTVENQIEELEAAAQVHGWRIVAQLSDRGISGTRGREDRPAFNELLKLVARREVDLVAAWSVDRLGRSLQHLIPFLADLQAKRIDLFLLKQGLDTSTPSGRAMFQMIGVFAEFEASMIKERVRSGLARARRVGTKSGRPIGRPRISGAKERETEKLLARGWGILRVAKATGLGTGTVARVAKAWRGAGR